MASHHPETHGGISKKIKQEKARKRERERERESWANQYRQRNPSSLHRAPFR
jgi:hypothetical protein